MNKQLRNDEWLSGAFLPIASQDYSDIHQFFVREAILLDHHRYDEWCGVFARDVRYTVRQAGVAAFQELPGKRELICEYSEIVAQIALLRSDTNDKRGIHNPTRRRFVANLSVCFADCRGEFDVVSYLLVSHYSRETASTTFLTAERHDRLRRRDRSFAITRRELLYDQTVTDPLGPMMLL